MQEIINKIILMLKEEARKSKCIGATIRYINFSDAIEIVNQVAEEYNGGWIPVSERLPETDEWCYVTANYNGKLVVVEDSYFNNSWALTANELIIAWMPKNKPDTYKPKGE